MRKDDSSGLRLEVQRKMHNADKTRVQNHEDEKLKWRTTLISNTPSIVHLGLRPSAYPTTTTRLRL
jgi:hypothetical protein